jgi:phosphoglycerate kinase
MIHLPPEVLAAVRAHAAATFPQECCGVLGGVGDRVSVAIPVENELASATHFRTEPRSMLAADRVLRAAGLAVVAVYHSHPTSAAVPSATDLRENPFGERVLCVIAGTDGVRAWRLGPASATEVPIRIVTTDSDPRPPTPLRSMPKKTLADLPDLTGKTVLVRVDFNVPLDKKTGAIKNDRRIRAAVPTIEHLLKAGAAVVAMSHLGRPEKATADERKNLTMDKVAARLGELLGRPVTKAADEVVGDAAAAAVKALKPGDVVLLENVRFDPREQKNDPEFAAAVAALGDAYVNDAFGTCHNDRDASMVAVPAALKAAGKPRAVGLLVAKELEVIEGLMGAPMKPLLAVMGGAKVSDKIAFIRALLTKVDHLLIGGKMAYTFLKAQGVDVGATRVADEELAAAQPLLSHVGKAITLPVDYLAAKSDDLTATKVFEGPIDAGYEGVDIGPKTLALFAEQIKKAGTVIWNGPVGWFEQEAFSRGTRGVSAAMAASPAVTVVGGGETAEAVEQFGDAEAMTHVSTGGGAFLAYVEGKPFQSLAQIDDK